MTILKNSSMPKARQMAEKAMKKWQKSLRIIGNRLSDTRNRNPVHRIALGRGRHEARRG